MAEFLPAYEFTMDNEDAERRHECVIDACPEGCEGPCFAISGVNSGAWPIDFATIEAVPQPRRGPFVQHFYALHFWNGWLGQLASQDLANHVFDGSVNSGPGNAAKWLQEALGTIGQRGIAVDGSLGPLTVAAANSVPAEALLDAYRANRVAFLREHLPNSPMLAALIARAMK
jgi:hypothetical protein